MKILLKNATTLSGKNCDFLTDGKYISKIGENIDGSDCDRVIDCKNKLIMPGLYNCHTHAAMTLFRGYGEDMPLDRWLNEKIFPAEDLLTNESVYVASELAAAEMIKNGIVSCTDMYFFCDQTVKAFSEAGIKANIGRSIVSFDENADVKNDSRVLESLRLFNEYHNFADGRIKIDMSLHAEYTNTERMSRYVAEKAKEIGANIHLHLSETEKEHRECMERRGGRTPAQFFRDCGVFDVRTTAAHCVYVTEEDIGILKEYGVTVAHNPVSNLKLGSGVMPLSAMNRKNVNIALGTDGAASNNTLDIMKEMYIAAILHKGIERKPEAHKAGEFIKMATENGARAQGRDDCGALEEGKKADIILINLDDINNIPTFDMSYTAVYSAGSSNIAMTMIDGNILYENGEFKTVDIEKIKYDMRCVCGNYFKAKD